MATKIRIGMRCYNPFVPNEVWDLFKKELRQIFKIAFPNQVFQISEFYWANFPVTEEYIRIRPKDEAPVDWKRIWTVLDFTAQEFGMKIRCIYQKRPQFHVFTEDPLFERKYAEYSLINIRTWTIAELDEFLKTHSFDELRQNYYEAAL